MTHAAFSLIIFDLDGVLVASDACHARAYDELWAQLGIAGPPYREIAGRRTRDVVAEQCARAGVRADLEASVRFKQERARACLASEPIVFDDTPAALARFAKAARLAVGTGASQETAELLLSRVGMRGDFELVVSAEDVPRGKPAPDVYERVLARAGVAAARALVVEDSAAGVAAALAAGAHVALVRTHASVTLPEGDPRVLGAFEDLGALADALGLAQ